MGLLDRLGSFIRRIIVVFCLFPVSFTYYPDMRIRMKALCSGKTFFRDAAERYSVRQNLAKRSLFCWAVLGTLFELPVRSLRKEVFWLS